MKKSNDALIVTAVVAIVAILALYMMASGVKTGAAYDSQVDMNSEAYGRCTPDVDCNKANLQA